MRCLLVLSALGVMAAPAAPGALGAQRLPAPFVSVSQRTQAPGLLPDTMRPPEDPLGTVVGGVLGGAAGFFAGARFGAGVENSHFWGAAIGESVGLAVGAHVGNGRRGNLGEDLVASLGVGAVGVAIVLSLGETGLLLAPVVQVAAVATTELTAGRR